VKRKSLTAALAAAALGLSVAALAAADGPVQAQGSVTFDAYGGADESGGSSLTWTQNIGTGTDRAVLAELTVSITNDVGCTQTLKLDGTTMTKLAIIHSDGAAAGYMDIWGATAPASGTATFSGTVANCPTGLDGLTGVSESFADVSQSSPFSAVTSATGVSVNPSATFSSSRSGDMVAGFAEVGKGFLGINSPATDELNQNLSWNTGAGNSSGAIATSTGGSVPFTWTISSPADYFGVGLVQLNSDSGSPSPAPTPSPSSSPGPSPSSSPTPTPSPTGSGGLLDTKTMCVYETSLADLQAFENTIGETVHCVGTFSNSDMCRESSSSSPCNPYNSWTNPWFDSGTPASDDWKNWLASDPSNRITLALQMVPQDVSTQQNDGNYDPNWRADCAAGDFRQYYPILAQNLINAGFGHAIIRLGHEMNGNWYPDNIGTTITDFSNWARCFDQIVTGMRSVPGAHFLFDWDTNQGYRNIPYSEYYPGNNYVDMIGIDAYDSGMPGNPTSQPDRWNAEYTEGSGFQQLIQFAQQQGKPISIPEWGLPNSSGGGIDDDPYYVQQIASIIANNNVVYQSYFDIGTDGIDTIESQPNSWAAYKAAFGPGGTVGQGTGW
jgi:hypothetical protein